MITPEKTPLTITYHTSQATQVSGTAWERVLKSSSQGLTSCARSDVKLTGWIKLLNCGCAFLRHVETFFFVGATQLKP